VLVILLKYPNIQLADFGHQSNIVFIIRLYSTVGDILLDSHSIGTGFNVKQPHVWSYQACFSFWDAVVTSHDQTNINGMVLIITLR